jgi:4-hydroxybenzoate polyprenyltransferase
MIIIDFLVYYLTYWFEKNKKKLVWSTPLQRAIYAVMIATAGIFAFFEIILEITIWKQSGFKIPKYIYILLAVALDFLLEHIYIKKGRYEKIAAKGFNMNTRTGVVISIIVIFFCTVGWLICYMIIVPPGSNPH